MSLCLVVHELGSIAPEVEQRFFAAVFEVAPSHLRVTASVTLMGTEVSPRYLCDYLKAAARRAGIAPFVLLATEVPEGVAVDGLTAEGEAWLRDMLRQARDQAGEGDAGF